jgi:hypothetical protein
MKMVEEIKKMEKPEEKVPRFDKSVETKDKTPHTWINEALWKKVFFKVLANFVYVLGLAIITSGSVGFDFNKFITGLQVIILPVIWSALDAQARNKEIQERIASDEALAKAKAVADKNKIESDKEIAKLKKSAEDKHLEIYRLKAVLMAKTDNANALDEAVKKAEEIIKTAESLDTSM